MINSRLVFTAAKERRSSLVRNGTDPDRVIDEAVRDRLGGTHSARILLWSFDFAEIEALQATGRWDEAAALVVDAARRLEHAGAGLVLICANTMHRMADEVQAAIGIPLLHIADATAAHIREAGLYRVGLLGTRFTMEHDFYRGRLADRCGLDVLVPDTEDRATVHRVVYEELVQGRVEDASRDACRAIIARLVARGAQGIVLGCTEYVVAEPGRLCREAVRHDRASCPGRGGPRL